LCLLQITRLGVEIRTNSPIGPDRTLDDLRKEGYRAFFVAVGAHRSQSMRIPGEDKAGVLPAVEFLRDVNLCKKPCIGRRVAVVGGGNVAMDAARVAIRLGAEEVHLVYRRQREDMPAQEEEIEEAEREGVQLHLMAAPLEVLGADRVTGLRCQRMRPGAFDDSGRRRPVPEPGAELVLEVDTVIAAIGQAPAVSPGILDGVEVSAGRPIPADPLTAATSLPDVFAGGDAVSGPATVIKAIAAGHRAAISIDRYLRGELVEPVLFHEKQTWKQGTHWPIPEDSAELLREPVPLVPVGLRQGKFAEVEAGYDEPTALHQAQRCLHCDLEEE
ncbi:MAG: FAD-dependent oxidoreductase, partial [Chloroflexi bacterium]|nr:FAD-dependent oxidoreductase [Chloroflexota bacterium]